METKAENISAIVYREASAKHMIEAGDSIVIGVSGGADSLCLLFLLHELKQKISFKIKVVHVHHGIRQTTADKDAAYVKEICERLEVPCQLVYADIPKIAKENHETLEEAGRRVRYDAFEKAFDDTDSARKIAVAHHMNDQAETVIHNMVRGSGIHGMTGMRSVEVRENSNIKLIRPLLCFSRRDIESFLNEKNISYCIDETNFENEYTRNSIRNEIMPALNNINAKAAEHIAQMAERLSKIEDFLEQEAADRFCELAEKTENGVELFIDNKCTEILYKEIIRLCIKDTAGRLKDISAEHIDSVYELSVDGMSGKGIDLPYNLRVIRSYDRLIFSQNTKSREMSSELLPEIELIDAAKVDINQYPKESYTKWFDYDKIRDGAVFRRRKSGDVIAIKGGSQKLQDFFTKQKVPVHLRDSVWVLAIKDSSEIVWVVGDTISRISEKYKVCETTRQIAEIKAPQSMQIGLF